MLADGRKHSLKGPDGEGLDVAGSARVEEDAGRLRASAKVERSSAARPGPRGASHAHRDAAAGGEGLQVDGYAHVLCVAEPNVAVSACITLGHNAAAPIDDLDTWVVLPVSIHGAQVMECKLI